jgi:signal transduction histidine kinase
MPLPPRTLTVTAAAVGAAATLAVAALPFARFAYRSVETHVALETTAGLIALLAALLVLGRFRERGLAGALGMACALGMLGASSLLFYVVPAIAEDMPGRFATWAPMTASLLGSAVFAGASLRPGPTLERRRRAAIMAILGAAAALGVLALTMWAVSGSLPQAIEPTLSPEDSQRPTFAGHWAVIAIQALGAAFYAAAAIGLTRRAERTGDELLRWFAAGAALAVFARVNYVLFPSRISEWLYAGDFLRLAFYAVLAYGAAREIAASQRARAAAAVLEERRRVARELHDGLAQELAFIVSRTRGLAGRDGDGDAGAAQLASAAERALDESRRAIAALTQPLDEPLDAAIAREAEGIAERAGVRVRLELAERPAVAAPTREALLRIVREAITNAVRHGGASAVTVRLSPYGDLRLEVIDDGRGFDTAAAPRAGSVGLRSMRERAEALGGTVTVSSRPGSGTSILVVVPE